MSQPQPPERLPEAANIQQEPSTQQEAVNYDQYGNVDPFNPPPGRLPDGSPEPVINPLVRFSVRNVVFSIGVFVVIVLLGLISASRLGTNLLPDFEVPVLAVSTTYPGATPEQVNREVSRRIENAVSTTAGIGDITTTSVGSQSAVVISFNNDVDIDAAANSVSQSLAAIRGTLPDGAEAPIVQKYDPNAQPILTLSLLSGGAGTGAAARYAEDILLPRLQRIPGVADVSISGGQDREIQVLLSPERLNTYNLTAQQVSGAIQSSALDVPAGTLTQDGQQISFSTRNTPTTLRDVEHILVDSQRGLTVADIAAVRDGDKEITSLSRVNGQPAVLLNIRKLSGSNSVAVSNAVRKAVAEQQAELPAGYTFSVATDTTEQTRATISDTFSEFLLAIVAVGIIVLLFLGRLDTVFAVILAVPISISAAPLLYGQMGFTFNIISLLAIIVAIGIVVDDSIVVAENVQRFRAMGYSRLKSVLLGGSEVFSAVTAASFSLLAVLIPLSLMPGLLGQVFSQFGLGLAAAIVMSWLESLLFLTVRMAYTKESTPVTWAGLPARLAALPAQFITALRGVRTGRGLLALALAGAASWLLADNIAHGQGYRIEPWGLALISLLGAPLLLTLFRYLAGVLLGFLEALTGTLHHATEGVVQALARAYARSVRWLLGRPWVSLAAAALFLVSAPLAMRNVGFAFVPSMDGGMVMVTLDLPLGTDLTSTNKVTTEIEQRLLTHKEVKIVQANVGTGGPSSFGGSNTASITATLADKSERPAINELVDGYRAELEPLIKGIPGAELTVASFDTGPSGSTDLSLGLTAPTQALLRERNAVLLDLLTRDPQVATVQSSLSDTRQERVFVPDPQKLSGTGITASDIASALRTYNDGSVAGELRDGDTSVDIRVRLDPALIPTEQALLNQTVYSPVLKANLPLAQLGGLRIAEAPATITRLNKSYSSTLDINLAKGTNAFAYRQHIIDQAKAAGLLNDNVTLGDANSFGTSSLTGDLVFYGPILILMSVLLTYLVLGSQFNSFRYPFYLLLPIPLALVGGLWSLSLFGADLGVVTMLGMIILIGLSTKNSILYLEFVTERMRAMPLHEALIEASELRFRPIIMTTLTVLVISIPLVLGHGSGAEFRRGLGIVILGGIVTSTLLTFYVVPSVFYLAERGRQNKMGGGSPGPEGETLAGSLPAAQG